MTFLALLWKDIHCIDGHIIDIAVTFYPNVTTLRSGLCCRNSICRLSVTLVHPTQAVEAFGHISSPLCTLAIL